MPLKQLTITPVSFPTTTQPTIPPTSNPHSHPHRIPSAAFHPTHTHTTPQSSLPFRSFDISSATSSFPSPGLGLGPFPSSSSSSSLFLDEPPLLEELEINPALILQKTRSLLNPFNPNPSLHASEPDLSGPFLYYPAFSLFQLLAGKLQFGIILGWIAISSLFLYSLLNFLAGRTASLDLYRGVTVVSYCLMPIVIFSAVSLFLPPIDSSIIDIVVAGVFVVWATRVCSRLLAEDSLGSSEHRGLIAFPCFLIYTLFSMLVMF